jgi:tetratricopeptide (TPR) repeat protein
MHLRQTNSNPNRALIMKRVLHTISSTFLAMSLLFTSPTFGFNNKFPGKGDPASWEASRKIYHQANVLSDKGKGDEAVRLFEQAIRIYPYDADYYDNLGHTLEDLKLDFAKAEFAYRTGMKVEPDDAHIRISYAGLLFEQKKIDESERMIHETEKLPVTSEERHSITKALSLIKRYKEDHK